MYILYVHLSEQCPQVMSRLGLFILVVARVWAGDPYHDTAEADQSQGEKEDTEWYYISAAVLFGVVILFMIVIAFLCNIRYLADTCDKIKHVLCATSKECVPVTHHHDDDEYKQSLMSPGYSSGSESAMCATKNDKQDGKQ
ncbi:uncharacterized protein LOC117318443 [Pecten maximus]|uniref:uncharacterized protein LOC117318443 n=1 Tax=Pecten maximus TaxID=6579 RepID=UPI001458BCA2|nr:uncharacterized protein LOC117318443 [Pecten maximus]